MASVREIARATGVSPATVSRVINNHPSVATRVRDKVLAAVNRARYVPTVARRSTTNIGFVYTGDSSLGSPFDAALMEGMGAQMDELGFDLMILDAIRSKAPDETFSQMFMRKGVRGVVLRTTASTRAACEQIADEGFPAVVIGDRFDHPRVSYIAADSRQSSREATAHLAQLGHRRIAMAVNVVDDTDHTDRVEGYREALAAAGLKVDPSLILRTPANLEGGHQLLRRLLAMDPRPTAVFAADPMSAVGCINEAQRAGLSVPDDLAVVGFDDGQLRHIVHPTMSAVCQDAKAMGAAALEALRVMFDEPGRKQPIRRVLPTWFEVNGSTARALPRA
jgi:DNA-binding LacI/PurR family transcriptional regulator